eukprot:scaffold808_cov370-Prasinococcus_capsulatus_cf.AAC.6
MAAGAQAWWCQCRMHRCCRRWRDADSWMFRSSPSTLATSSSTARHRWPGSSASCTTSACLSSLLVRPPTCTHSAGR